MLIEKKFSAVKPKNKVRITRASKIKSSSKDSDSSLADFNNLVAGCMDIKSQKY